MANTKIPSELIDGTLGVAGITSSADATAITINSSEQVGIGTTSPNARLVVGGTEAADTTYLRLQNTPATAATHKVAMEFWGNEGTADASTFNMGRIYGEFDGSSYATTRLTLGSASGGGTFNDELNIKNGKVSIGTTSADSLFHIESASTTAMTIQAGTNSSASIRLKNDAHDWDLNCQTNDNFAIYSHTLSAETLVVNASTGNVGINISAPTSKFYVDGGTFAGYVTNFYNAGSGGGNHGMYMETQSTSSYLGIWRTGGTTRFYVDGSGNYYFSGSNQSDRNKKENISDITDNALDLITQLVPKKYNFIGSDIDKAGFIAQDMEAVIPRLVSGNEFDPNASDDVETNPTGKGIDYMGYTAYLTKAIQELKADNDALKARIETLENN